MGRFLQVKHPHYHDYSEEQVAQSEQVLLTIWPKLADHHEYLALVGGLVPRYLCTPEGDTHSARTLDVDLAISILADDSRYEPLSMRLRSEGFVIEKNRFVKEVNGNPVYIDFLTDSHPPGGSVIPINDIPANAFPGVERALTVTRNMEVAGKDLNGAKVKQVVRVCEAGPYLCLKLSSYQQRGEAKDLYDALQVGTRYDKGSNAAIAAFHDEENVNEAYPIALEVLRAYCLAPEGRGPVQYANFCMGALRNQMPGRDFEFLYSQRVNTAVTFGNHMVQRINK